MKTPISEMKNMLIDMNGRLDITGEKISELEDVEMETIQMKHTQKESSRIEQSISKLWENFKQPNTHTIGGSEGWGRAR